MSYTYTDATSVESELQTTTPFSGSTLPTLSQITSWIEEESAQINQDAGMYFGSTAYTTEIDYNGEETITLKNSPIITVDLFEYNANKLGSSLGTDYKTKTEDTDFTVYEDSGEIAILFDNFSSPQTGRKRFKIAYTAGYTTTPDMIKKLATKMVTLRVLNTLITKNVNEANDGGSISVGSISIVEPASYGVNSYKQLKLDIEELKSSITKGFGVYRYDSYGY